MPPPAFAMVQELRAAGMRAEAYVGNGKIGDQIKYADKRGAAIAVIEGGDERARGEVTLQGSGAGRRTGQVGGKPRRLGRRTARRRISVKRADLVAEIKGDAEGQGRLMAAFPYYDAAAIDALNAQAEAMLELFARARLCPRGTVGAAAGRNFPRPFGRGNPPPHLHADRSVGPRTVPAPRSHHSDLPACGGGAARNFPRGFATTAWPSAISRASRIVPPSSSRPARNCWVLTTRAAGDTEILSLAVEALRAAGLKDFSLRDRRSGTVRRAGRCAGRCRRNGARA